MSPDLVKNKPPPTLDQKAAWIRVSGGELEKCARPKQDTEFSSPLCRPGRGRAVDEF